MFGKSIVYRDQALTNVSIPGKEIAFLPGQIRLDKPRAVLSHKAQANMRRRTAMKTKIANANSKSKRTVIEDLAVEGTELSDEHLQLVSGSVLAVSDGPVIKM